MAISLPEAQARPDLLEGNVFAEDIYDQYTTVPLVTKGQKATREAITKILEITKDPSKIVTICIAEELH